MPVITVDITQDTVMTALRTFILSLVPDGTPVIAGQDNRVAEPEETNYIEMTPLMQPRLGWNRHAYTGTQEANGNVLATQPTEQVVQVDCHGPASGDYATIIAAMFFDPYAVASFGTSGVALTPLYCTTPRQMPFESGEDQTEERWSFDIHMQADITVTMAQQSATKVVVDIINVDVQYPPE